MVAYSLSQSFMRFLLTLTTTKTNALLPFNYQYPVSAAIYKIIERADSVFAAFLHDSGYTNGGKTFKLFTFSDIQTPFVKNGDRMMLTTNNAELIVCFYMPQAAENFIKGLFMKQLLEITDRSSKAVFTVAGVEALSDGVIERSGDGVMSVMLQPLSPLVVGRKNERGHYDYRSPTDTDFTDGIVYNWMEKWGAVHDASEVDMEALRKAISVEVKLWKCPPQQRLITIKAGTDAETKVRGYMKFDLMVTAPQKMLQLLLGSGAGIHNSIGLGCLSQNKTG